MNDDAYKGIMLAVDGYGSASVSGRKDDESRITISTGESPVTKDVSDSDDPKAIIVQLLEVFMKIWRRKDSDE